MGPRGILPYTRVWALAIGASDFLPFQQLKFMDFSFLYLIYTNETKIPNPN